MNLARCLYFPNQPHLFNRKHSLLVFLYLLIIISYFAFLFFEADAVTEYVNSAYVTVAAFGAYLSFVDTSFKTNAIFELIDNIEEISKRSK